MLNETCNICGDHESFHQGNQAERAASLFMMERAAEMLPQEYGDTLRDVLIDWRTHTFPPCDPFAID